MPRLAAYVHVTDPEHGTAAFGPNDDVPEWAVPHITNPKAWAEPPADQPPADQPPAGQPPVDESGGDTPPAYSGWKVDQLREEVARRNAVRDADHVSVDEPGNKAELVAALQADDTRN